MPLPALHHHKTFLHLVAFEKMRFFAASPCKLRLGVVAFSFQGDWEDKGVPTCSFNVAGLYRVAGVLLNTADLFSGFWQSCFLHSKQNMPFPSTNANHHIFVSEQKASSFLCNHSCLELPQSLEQLEHNYGIVVNFFTRKRAFHKLSLLFNFFLSRVWWSITLLSRCSNCISRLRNLHHKNCWCCSFIYLDWFWWTGFKTACLWIAW